VTAALHTVFYKSGLSDFRSLVHASSFAKILEQLIEVGSRKANYSSNYMVTTAILFKSPSTMYRYTYPGSVQATGWFVVLIVLPNVLGGVSL
jgi:hypothetical protein